MFSKVGFGCWISLETLKLILPLTWVVVISLKCSLMPGVDYSKFGVIGILFCLICIGLWLLLLGFLLNVTGGAVLLLVGISVVSLKLASLLSGSMLILPLSLVLLVSWVGHGFNFMAVEFLVLTLLPGLTVLAFFVNLLPFIGTLHWPVGSEDLCHFGVSFFELLILFEQWAGHRLLSEKVTRPRTRASRITYSLAQR